MISAIIYIIAGHGLPIFVENHLFVG